ncbi:MAG TPA: PTS transporter subunit EIIB [Chthoniobacterales bacterium]|jgi:PTS system glucose-specific IIC component
MEEYLKSVGPEADEVEARFPVPAPPAAGVISKLRDADAARKVAAWIDALGGPANIERVDDCAATRLRVALHSAAGVDQSALGRDGIDAVVSLPGNTLHLLVGLTADQYAAEMLAQLAAREAA